MSLGNTFNRFLKLTADFKDLALRVSRLHVSRLKRIKKKYERNVARQNSLPPELPRINWEYYRENLGPECHDFITEYEKKYKAFEIPLPDPKFMDKFDALREEYACEVKEYNEVSDCRIKHYDDALQEYKNLLPYGDMTMEDFALLFPKDAPDFINRPTFWPHTPEEQIGYVKPGKVYVKKDVRDPKNKASTSPKEDPGIAKEVKETADKKMPPISGK